MQYSYIDNFDSLSSAVKNIEREKSVAFDMECDNNIHHYGNRICLMQFATPRQIYLIDTLASLDLGPIRKIMENRNVEKVMHDTDFDLRSLDAEYGWRPVSLFDTKVAARLLGHKSFGVAALISHYFNAHIEKKKQRADWSRRPLPDSMLEYAAADVHYLIDLRERLSGELESKGRISWAQEEFSLCEQTHFEPDTRPPFAKVKRAYGLSGQELAALNEITIERDAIAREFNLPLFKIISDEKLVEIVKGLPESLNTFWQRGGMHPYLRNKGRERFAKAIRRGMIGAPLKWPRSGDRSMRRKESPKLLAALKEWRKTASEKIGVDPDVFLPQSALKDIAAGDAVETALSDARVRRWQQKLVSPMLAAFLKHFSKSAD